MNYARTTRVSNFANKGGGKMKQNKSCQDAMLFAVIRQEILTFCLNITPCQ